MLVGHLPLCSVYHRKILETLDRYGLSGASRVPTYCVGEVRVAETSRTLYAHQRIVLVILEIM
jgi:hypothetical protein